MSSSAGAAAGASGAGAAAAIANAIKACGVLVKMTPEDFQYILDLQDAPLVVVCEKTGWFRRTFGGEALAHLTSYKGLAFYCESKTPLEMPEGTEVVVSEKIYIPSM